MRIGIAIGVPRPVGGAGVVLIGLSGVRDIDYAGNAVPDDAAIGDYAGVTAFASHVGFTVALSLSDDAGGLFSLEAGTGRVLVAAPLTIGSHTITVLASSSDGVSTASESFTINVAPPAQSGGWFAPGYFAAGYFAPSYFAGMQ